MSKSLERIHRLALELLLVIWVIACAMICWMGAGTIEGIGAWQIPIGMFGIIAGVISGTYFFVIFTIPFRLASRFDPIKNKVALKEFQSVDEFQEEIAQFIIKFFRFSGANVEGGIFQFKNCNELKLNFNEEFSINDLSDLTNIKKIKSQSGKRLFYIPIRLANIDLGWMLLKMEGFTMSLFPELISDFENMYLDDQLLHVLSQYGFDHQTTSEN